MTTDLLKTTLLLIPGGQGLALPDNAAKFKSALKHSVLNKKAQIIMLADDVLVPEEIVQETYPYKNVLLIESETITTTDDVWEAAYRLLDGHLPAITSSGFDYQVIQMELVDIKYEDFERLAKFM